MISKEELVSILNEQVNIFERRDVKFGKPWTVVVRDADGTQYFLNRQKVGTESSSYAWVIGNKLSKQTSD